MSKVTTVDQSNSGGSILAVLGLAALAAQDYLALLYQCLALLALVIGLVSTTMNLVWKIEERRKLREQDARWNDPRILAPKNR